MGLRGSSSNTQSTYGTGSSTTSSQSDWSIFREINKAGGIDEWKQQIIAANQTDVSGYLNQIKSLQAVNQGYQTTIGSLQKANENLQMSTQQVQSEMSKMKEGYIQELEVLQAAQDDARVNFEEQIKLLQQNSGAKIEDYEALQSEYDELVQQFEERKNYYTPLVEEIGAQEKRAALQDQKKLEARVKQLMISRGMSATSAMDAAKREISESTEAQLTALEGQYGQEKAAYMESLGQDVLTAKGAAADMEAAGAQAKFQFRQMPTELKGDYAALLAQQNATKAMLTGGYKSMNQMAAGLGDSLNSSAYSFNRGMQLQMKQLEEQKKLGYAGIDANALMAQKQRQQYAPVYSHISSQGTMGWGGGHSYNVRTG